MTMYDGYDIAGIQSVHFSTVNVVLYFSKCGNKQLSMIATSITNTLLFKTTGFNPYEPSSRCSVGPKYFFISNILYNTQPLHACFLRKEKTALLCREIN